MGGGSMERLKALGGGKLPPVPDMDPAELEAKLKELQSQGGLPGLGGPGGPGGLPGLGGPGLPGFPPKKN